MELYERYERTPPAERPPEVAFYHAQGFAGPLYAVVRDSAMWSWLWRGLNRGIMRVDGTPYELPLPRVDFAREMLVVVGIGARPTTAYWVHIDSLRLREARGQERELWVYVTEERGTPRCGAAGTITRPAALARLRSVEAIVRFHLRVREATWCW
jgi:hypothetical protein